jgi:hypothetical protein
MAPHLPWPCLIRDRGDRVFSMIEPISQKKQNEIENRKRLERAADLLIRLPQHSIFFQDKSTNYLIRVSPKFGYMTAPLINTN